MPQGEREPEARDGSGRCEEEKVGEALPVAEEQREAGDGTRVGPYGLHVFLLCFLSLFFFKKNPFLIVPFFNMLATVKKV